MRVFLFFFRNGCELFLCKSSSNEDENEYYSKCYWLFAITSLKSLIESIIQFLFMILLGTFNFEFWFFFFAKKKSDYCR